MHLLDLYLDRDPVGRLVPSQIGFSGSRFRLFPADHHVLQKAKKGITALADLCIAHVIWDKPPVVDLERPFMESTPSARTLYHALVDRLEWLNIIFGRDPKDLFLTALGHPRSKSHRVVFTDEIWITIYIKKTKITSTSQLADYFLDDQLESPLLLPPLISLRHVERSTYKTITISETKQKKGLRLRSGDQVWVSAATVKPDLTSIFWIDSRSQVLVLKFAGETGNNFFQLAIQRTSETAEIVISPSIEMDDISGTEYVVALLHETTPNPANLEFLTNALSKMASHLPPDGFVKWFTHCYSQDSLFSHHIGAHPAIETDNIKNIVTENLLPLARTFQLVALPHI